MTDNPPLNEVKLTLNRTVPLPPLALLAPPPHLSPPPLSPVPRPFPMLPHLSPLVLPRLLRAPSPLHLTLPHLSPLALAAPLSLLLAASLRLATLRPWPLLLSTVWLVSLVLPLSCSCNQETGRHNHLCHLLRTIPLIPKYPGATHYYLILWLGKMAQGGNDIRYFDGLRDDILSTADFQSAP